MQVHIKPLIEDVQWAQTVRAVRWPDGIACPSVPAILNRGKAGEGAGRSWACIAPRRSVPRQGRSRGIQMRIVSA